MINNKNKPLLSIISGIYNPGKKLLAFLDSLSNQTYENIEVILINDCSTDQETIKILNDLQKNRLIFKKPLKIINNKKNLNIIKTFQKGLNIAKGEYFAFPESDDYLDYDFYEVCMKKFLVNNFDIVKGLLLTEYEENGILEDNVFSKKERKGHCKYSSEIHLISGGGTLSSVIYTDFTYCWFYVFNKKSLLNKNNKLDFKQAIKIGFSEAFILNKKLKMSAVSLEEASFYHFINYDNIRDIDMETINKQELQVFKQLIKDLKKND